MGQIKKMRKYKQNLSVVRIELVVRNAMRKKSFHPFKRLKKIFSGDNRDVLLDKSRGLHPGRTYVEPRRYTKEGMSINYVFTR